MHMDQYITDFINEYSPKPYNKTYLKNLLTGEKDYSFVRLDGYEEIELLDEIVMESVQAVPRAKDSAIAVYKSFVKYLQNQGEEVEVTFPPVPIDSSFERQMFIAKYLQDDDATILDLQDVLWVSDRTIEKDLQRLRKESADPISVCGRQFFIPGTDRKKSKLDFSSTSTLHPIFLTENLTQVIIMLEGLKHMAENPNYQRYAETTAANIWEQLSDYAKNRIRTVIGPILPGDLSWYESLTRDPDNTFQTENNCSVPGNVFTESVKNEKPFYIEYEEAGKTIIYEKCVFVYDSYKVTTEGNRTFEVDCTKGRVVLEENNIRRTAFKIEELL